MMGEINPINRIQDRDPQRDTTAHKSSLLADDSAGVDSMKKAASNFDRAGGSLNGKPANGGEFTSADYAKSKQMHDAASKADTDNQVTAGKRESIRSTLQASTQKPDATATKKKY